MGTITVSSIRSINAGSEAKKEVVLAFGSSYNNTGNDNTTGESLSAATLGLSQIGRIDLDDVAGYTIQPLYSISGAQTTLPGGVRLKVFQGASGTTSSTSAGTPAGTVTTVFEESVSSTPDEIRVYHGAVVGTPTLNEIWDDGGGNSFRFLSAQSGYFVVDTIVGTIAGGTGFTGGTSGATTTTSSFPTLTTVYHTAFPIESMISYVANTSALFSVYQNIGFTTASSTRLDATNYPAAMRYTKGSASFEVDGSISLGFLAPQLVTYFRSAITGSALAGHTHTIGAAAGGEVPNGTNLSTALSGVRATVYGY